MLDLQSTSQNIDGANLEKGDCGCLAVGSNGVVYGHLVSGDLAMGVGHIIPVAQTLQEMIAQTFPTLKIASELQLQSSYAFESSAAIEIDNHSNAPPAGVSVGPSIHMDRLDVVEQPSPPPTRYRTDETSNKSHLRSQVPPTNTSNKTSGISQSLGMKNRRLIRRPLRLWSSSVHQSVRHPRRSPADVVRRPYVPLPL